MIKMAKNSRFMEIFDTLFIMILCFVTLLATMLMQGGIIVGDSTSGIHYVFNIRTLIAVVAGFAAYLFIIIPQSDKELRVMTKQLYDEDEEVEK